jgi:L,D-transpeptidase ErfK/SrfK
VSSAATKRIASIVACAFLVAGCATLRIPLPRLFAAKKMNTVTTRIPAKGELPGLVGKLQHARVGRGQTLLDVAREGGVGYQQLQDANPQVDEWVPQAGTDVLIPSRWIIPRSRHKGIVINLPEMRLYLFPETTAEGEKVEVRTWPIGIGTEQTPSPVHSFRILTKEENPTWVVPASILKTMDPPRPVVPPGPDNPLGAYRMRLSYDIYSIHGTDTPWAVGRLGTHGCIRLYPEDIGELYADVRVGTTGEIVYQPVKVGEDDGRIFVEVHPDIYRRIRDFPRYAREEVRRAGVKARVDPARLTAAVEAKSGVPVDVTRDQDRSVF